MQTTTANIRSQIQAMRALTTVDSISPDSLGAVLIGICSAIDTLAAAAAADAQTTAALAALQTAVDTHEDHIQQLSTLTSVLSPLNTAGRVPTLTTGDLLRRAQVPKLSSEQLPDHVVYTNTLLLETTARIWHRVLQHCDPDADQDLHADQARYRTLNTAAPQFDSNGYHPGNTAIWDGQEIPAYFSLYGYRFTLGQALIILFDRFIPGTGGVQMVAEANLPVSLKSTDSRLSLDYLCTNNWQTKVLTLGTDGLDDTVCPISMHRTFHGAGNIIAVIGRISLKYITGPDKIYKAFEGAPNLAVLLLQDIPNAITQLDLSGISPNFKNPYQYYDSEGTMRVQYPLLYLLGHLGDRTAPLEISMPKTAFDYAVTNSAVAQAVANAPCTVTFTTPGLSGKA